MENQEQPRVLWPHLTRLQADRMINLVRNDNKQALDRARDNWVHVAREVIRHRYDPPPLNETSDRIGTDWHVMSLTPREIENLQGEINRAAAHYLQIAEDIKRLGREAQDQYQRAVNTLEEWDALAEQAYRYFHPDPVDEDDLPPMWDDRRDNP